MNIVCERSTEIYHLDIQRNKVSQIKLNISADNKTDTYENKTYSNNISEYAVSPNGKLLAFVIRGEIFVKENDKEKKRSVNITENPYRDQNVNWLNDSTLVFTSDRDGNYELYLTRSSDKNNSDIFKSLKHETIKLTDSKLEINSPVISNDGKQIVYLEGRGKLIAADIKENNLSNKRVLLEGWSTPSGITWSPDNKWLAYSIEDIDFNEEVFIHSLTDIKKYYNVSMHPRPDRNPFWSEDGSKLGFISNRNNVDNDLWFAWLKKEDWQKTKTDWEEADNKNDKEGKRSKDKDSTKTVDIKIDTDNIHERLVQVTGLPGNESDIVISEDGETFFFVTNRNSNLSYKAEMDLHSIKWDGTKMKALTTGDQKPSAISIDKDGKYLYMLKTGGSISRLEISSSKDESLPFSSKMVIDFETEKEQKFEEAWRTLNEGFYDPKFHGQDWDALKKKYKLWAMKASTDNDFRDMFNLMLGQLNSSHMGLFGSDRTETQNERSAYIGVEVKPLSEGVEITKIIVNSPADRESSKLKLGEVILSVDSKEITEETNFESLFLNKSDELTLLEVKSPDGNIREVIIRPTSSLRDELYEEWVKEHQKLTDEYSKGRLGYIHIQGMSWPSFERFERELTAAGSGKEGIIIDVRFNGGGWTTDYLMTVLTYKQHAYTIPRGAVSDLDKEHKKFINNYAFGERLPFSSWTKPSAAMCNGYSYSNAEIFSHAYQSLGLRILLTTRSGYYKLSVEFQDLTP